MWSGTRSARTRAVIDCPCSQQPHSGYSRTVLRFSWVISVKAEPQCKEQEKMATTSKKIRRCSRYHGSWTGHWLLNQGRVGASFQYIYIVTFALFTSNCNSLFLMFRPTGRMKVRYTRFDRKRFPNTRYCRLLAPPDLWRRSGPRPGPEKGWS